MLINIETITFLFIYCAACLGQGYFIFKVTKKIHDPRISDITLLSSSFILGSSTLASIWMLLSLAGLLKTYIILMFLLPSAVYGFYSASFYKASTIAAVTKRWHETKADTWAWQWIASISTFLLILGIFSMSKWGGDAIAFYMAVPKLIASTNFLKLLPGYEDFMSVGLLGEMHNAVFLKFNLLMPIKIFSGLHSLAGLLMLLSIASYTGLKHRGNWLVVAAYVTSSAIFQALGNGKVDLVASALGICAYYFALIDGPLLFIGLLVGFAGVLKLSYLLTVFPGIAFLLIIHEFKKSKSSSITTNFGLTFLKNITIKGIIVGLWCIAAFSPHILKNYVLLNAPLAPFSGPSNIGWMDQNFFNEKTTFRILLSYPFATTFGNYWGQDGNLSPLLLAFFPFIFFLPRPKKWLDSPLFLLTVASLLGMIFWLIRFPSVLAPRYYLPTLLILFPAGFRGAEYVFENHTQFQWPKFFIYLCTLLTLFAVGIISIYSFEPSLLVKQLSGKIQQCDLDITGENGICTIENQLNKNVKQGARIYLTTYYRYWLRTDLIQCTNGKTDINREIMSSKGPDIWIYLYKRNFTYLVQDGTRPALDPIINHPPDWIALNPIISKNSTTVYKIEYINPPKEILPEVSCVKINDQGLWSVNETIK